MYVIVVVVVVVIVSSCLGAQNFGFFLGENNYRHNDDIQFFSFTYTRDDSLWIHKSSFTLNSFRVDWGIIYVKIIFFFVSQNVNERRISHRRQSFLFLFFSTSQKGIKFRTKNQPIKKEKRFPNFPYFSSENEHQVERKNST